MRTVSNDFKSALTTFGRQYKNIINVYDYDILATEDDNNLITEDSNEIGANISDTSTKKILDDTKVYSISLIRKGEILSTLMKELDFEASEELDIGDIIDYKFGLLVDEENNSYEYIDYGRFIVNKKEYNEDSKTYNYVAYDYMLKTMKIININDFSPYANDPNTMVSPLFLLTKTCETFGLSINIDSELMSVISNFGIYIVGLSNTLKNELTYRDLLDTLCKYLGVSMYMENKELKIKLLGKIKYNEDEQYWYVDNDDVDIVATVEDKYFKDKNITFKKKYGKINSLLIIGDSEEKEKYAEDSTSIEENGINTYSIVNNVIMNDDNFLWENPLNLVTGGIFNLIKGVSYYTYDLSTYGILYLDWLDYFNISIDNTNYKCLLLNSEIKIKSGINEDIYTNEEEEKDTEYTTTASSKSNDIVVNTMRSRGNAYANGERLIQETEFNEVASKIPVNYSFNEVKTNDTWIDGKTIYKKVIDLGTLPNQNTIQIQSNLDSSKVNIIKIYGIAKDINTSETFPLPFVWGSTTEVQNYVSIFFGGTGSNGNIWLRTNRNMSSYNGIVVLEYTKN